MDRLLSVRVKEKSHAACFVITKAVAFIAVVGWPWMDTKYPSKPLCHSPSQLDRGEKIQQEAHGLRLGEITMADKTDSISRN